MRRSFSYGSWATTTLGLLGVTIAVQRLQRRQKDWLTATLAAVGTPLALGGLVNWAPVVTRAPNLKLRPGRLLSRYLAEELLKR